MTKISVEKRKMIADTAQKGVAAIEFLLKIINEKEVLLSQNELSDIQFCRNTSSDLSALEILSRKW